jgi:hypothetical protein
MRYVILSVVLAASFTWTAAVPAATIVPITLSNTGVTAPNNPDGTNSNIQTTAAAPDMYYQVEIPSSSSFQQALVVTDQGAYFRPGNSQYINDTGSGNNNEPVGAFDYRTTFNLNGVFTNTATISGTLYADDTIANILVNGVSTGISGGNFTSGGGLNFTIPVGFAGFKAGTNTLDFIVDNNGSSANPTAFDATLLQGTATTAPEPGALAALAGLCGMGLIGLVWRRRKTG